MADRYTLTICSKEGGEPRGITYELMLTPSETAPRGVIRQKYHTKDALESALASLSFSEDKIETCLRALAQNDFYQFPDLTMDSSEYMLFYFII